MDFLKRLVNGYINFALKLALWLEDGSNVLFVGYPVFLIITFPVWFPVLLWFRDGKKVNDFFGD